MNYKPIVSRKEDYLALMRAKINIAGSRNCRFGSMGGARAEMPGDLKDYGMTSRVNARSLWIMGSACGFTIEVIDMMLDKWFDVCPIPQYTQYDCRNSWASKRLNAPGK